jgi:hypothetical protein
MGSLKGFFSKKKDKSSN